MLFLAKLTDEWNDYPPIRMMVGARLGLKPQSKKSKDGNFLELLAMFPSGNIKPPMN